MGHVLQLISMKSLVVYYSRTGNTRKIAEELANALGCDIEEIIDTKNRSGILGFLRSGRDARNRSLTIIKDPVNNPADFDQLVIGTPIWAGHLSTPVRTYMSQNRENLKKVSFFCTAGGDKFSEAFTDMKEISGKSPIGTLGVSGKDIKTGNYKSKIEEFIKKIQF